MITIETDGAVGGGGDKQKEARVLCCQQWSKAIEHVHLPIKTISHSIGFFSTLWNVQRVAKDNACVKFRVDFLERNVKAV
jgi:hypothetical protein